MALSPDVERELAKLGKTVLFWAKDIAAVVDDVDYSGKADKVGGAPDGLLAKLNAEGNPAAVEDLTDYIGSIDIQVNDDGDGTVTLEYAGEEKGLYLLASVTINGQTATKQTIYPVPTGKTMIPFAVCFRSPSATLVGLVDADLGGNANADDWVQQVTLNAFTATTDFGFVMQPDQAAGPPIVPVKKTLYAAATVFGIKINTGSTDPATFVVDLIGYLF